MSSRRATEEGSTFTIFVSWRNKRLVLARGIQSRAAALLLAEQFRAQRLHDPDKVLIVNDQTHEVFGARVETHESAAAHASSAQDSQRASSDACEEPVRDRRATILVVDDEEDIRAGLAEILDHAGYRVEVAGNGEEALAVIQRRGPPALILLDLMMPIMDRRRFLTKLRAAEALASIPVLVISAAQNRAAPFALPVRDVLGKPLQLDRLLAAVSRYVA